MVTSAAFAVYLIELLKKLAVFVSKNPSFEFSPKAMAALLVVANAVASLLLALLGMDGFTLPTDWTSWAKQLLVAVIGALVSSGLYVFGYRPFAIWKYFYYEQKAYEALQAKLTKPKSPKKSK